VKGVDVVITDCDHPNVDIEGAIFAAAGLTWRLEACRTEEDVIRAGRDASALLVQYAPVSRRVLDALPACRVVARYGVGLDSVDVDAAAERGVRVVAIPDYCVDEVSDHALALVLALSRGVVQLDRAVHAGRWDFTAAGELHRTRRQRLGVLGAGKAGRALAAKAGAVGFDVVGHDPYVDEVPGLPLVGLDELLHGSDVVSLHLPLSAETYHIVDARSIGKMRPGALLVNTSRGGLVDSGALARALRDGHLGGAGLDVLEQEPIAADDPLLELPNVILTPHAAFYSEESIEELNQRVAEEIVATLAATHPMPQEVRR
jgi:D-3-phosphoglycerate dehydrogenase